jgi:hypothetical protein
MIIPGCRRKRKLDVRVRVHLWITRWKVFEPNIRGDIPLNGPPGVNPIDFSNMAMISLRSAGSDIQYSKAVHATRRSARPGLGREQ